MGRRIILDTNVLLSNPDIFDKLPDDEFIIHSIVAEELDNQIHNERGNDELAYKARKARNAIKAAKNVVYSTISPAFSFPIGWTAKNDNIILAVCKDLHVPLMTNDLAMQIKADSIEVKWEEYGKDCNVKPYTGFKTIYMSEEEMAKFYENYKNVNNWGLNINEYLLLSNGDQIVDKYKWTESGFKNTVRKNLKSTALGDLKPKDVFQEIAIDSLLSEQFTAIIGRAGSGKSLLSLLYSMWALQSGKYDKLIIMFNPAKVRSAVDMGFYGGNVLEKSLQQFIGHMLNSKFGDKMVVDTLISQGKIDLVPMADCRGMEVTDNHILYIPEAQNTDRDLMRICLSRVSKGAKVIIEGDPYNQVDSQNYNASKNGLIRAIDVFKDRPFFSFVELQNVYRSLIADVADKL